MKIDVIERPVVRVACRRYTGPYGAPLGRFWRVQMLPWLAEQGLIDCPRYGVPLDDSRASEPAQCRYDACVELPAGLSLPDVEETTVAGGRYARVRFKGTDTDIGAAWTALWRELEMGGEHAIDGARPPLEHYPRGAPYDLRTGVFACELCMPVSP